MDWYQQYILKKHLELHGMKDLVSLVNDQVDNNTLLEAIQEKLLEKDDLYQQMLSQATMMLEHGMNIEESYKTMLEARKKYALFHPHYQLINRLINNEDGPSEDCGCNN